jgi:DNA-binding response OmpR family regulator
LELHAAHNLEAAEKMVSRHYYRLAVMDFDTIGPPIFSFSASLRSASTERILIALMSEPRINVEERLFDSGVNDVVVGQHACARVLTKRISARMRNSALPCSADAVVRLKTTDVDFDRREVWCSGVTRPLPGILAGLLHYFLDNPNRAISREELARSPIWADSICSAAEDGGKTFDVNVGKLRKIIEPDPTHPEIIETVHGVGWKLMGDAICTPR